LDDPLRIDSLVEVLAAFVEDMPRKSKEFINEVEVLLLEDFTTKVTKSTKMVSRRSQRSRR
jgi:hypothetical protein